jgi:hypothetical protein
VERLLANSRFTHVTRANAARAFLAVVAELSLGIEAAISVVGQAGDTPALPLTL